MQAWLTGDRESSDAVKVVNKVSVAVLVGWDENLSMGGREDVTIEDKWEGDRERRLGRLPGIYQTHSITSQLPGTVTK